MVIVPRIAAVSYLNTIPFIYGIGHEGNLRAELLLSPPAVCAKNFAEHKADIALVPAAAVPSLADADVVMGITAPANEMEEAANQPANNINYDVERNMAEFLYFVNDCLKRGIPTAWRSSSASAFRCRRVSAAEAQTRRRFCACSISRVF